MHTLALRMRQEPRERWPDVLLMIGDQVYADEVSPETREFIEARRDTSEPPGEQVLDFEEYTRLYRESWSEPAIRWLFSTLSTAMVFDDHDVHDDWNISDSWVEDAREHEWWREHIVGALASYWVYQHIGNLAPGSHADDELLQRVKSADDAWPILAEFARRADRSTDGTRWSYCRDLGRTRLVVIDSRAGRVLEEGRRSMLDEEEWKWLGSSSRATSITCSSPPLCRGCWAARCTTSRLGTRPSPAAPGGRGWPGSASACAGPVTWSTGPPSRSPSSGWPSWCAR